MGILDPRRQHGTLEQSYRDIADHVKISGRNDSKINILKLVYDWLRNGNNGLWLRVRDNIDDTRFLSEAESEEAGVTGQRQ